MPETVTLNTDPYEFDGPEAKPGRYTVPSFGSFTAGDIRRIRHMDEVDQMFTLLEKVAEPDALAAVDAMSMSEVGEFFNAWQRAAGVDLPS